MKTVSTIPQLRNQTGTQFQRTDGMGFFPFFIPIILGGSALLTGGYFGYKAGSPEVDPATGKPIATSLDKLADGLSKAVIIGTVGFFVLKIAKKK